MSSKDFICSRQIGAKNDVRNEFCHLSVSEKLIAWRQSFHLLTKNIPSLQLFLDKHNLIWYAELNNTFVSNIDSFRIMNNRGTQRTLIFRKLFQLINFLYTCV